MLIKWNLTFKAKSLKKFSERTNSCRQRCKAPPEKSFHHRICILYLHIFGICIFFLYLYLYLYKNPPIRQWARRRCKTPPDKSLHHRPSQWLWSDAAIARRKQGCLGTWVVPTCVHLCVAQSNHRSNQEPFALLWVWQCDWHVLCGKLAFGVKRCCQSSQNYKTKVTLNQYCKKCNDENYPFVWRIP